MTELQVAADAVHVGSIVDVGAGEEKLFFLKNSERDYLNYCHISKPIIQGQRSHHQLRQKSIRQQSQVFQAELRLKSFGN